MHVLINSPLVPRTPVLTRILLPGPTLIGFSVDMHLFAPGVQDICFNQDTSGPTLIGMCVNLPQDTCFLLPRDVC